MREISHKAIDFVAKHADDDVRKLAFSASEILADEAPFALDQIAGRQTARRKLPSWAMTDGVIYPPHISMEQCSSEQTARYKAEVMRRVLGRVIPDLAVEEGPLDAEITDLTGGFGVDFSFMAREFKRANYIERQSHLCEMAQHNMPLLGLEHARIINKEMTIEDVKSFFAAKVAANECPQAVFIDPARRDNHGGRTYAIADCTPDICGFIDDLLRHTAVVMVKLSPMLDWHAVVDELNGTAVREVHIVSTGNECKELLVVLSLRYADELKVYCVNDESVFAFSENDSASNVPHIDKKTSEDGTNASGKDLHSVLLVPNASVMKAGCFKVISERFGVKEVGPSSHLFLSDHHVDNFPGKQYRIITTSSLNKKEIKNALQGMESANIACRNFPMKPEELRKKLKLKDGGKHYIFATTTAEGQRMIFVCLQPRAQECLC